MLTNFNETINVVRLILTCYRSAAVSLSPKYLLYVDSPRFSHHRYQISLESANIHFRLPMTLTSNKSAARGPRVTKSPYLNSPCLITPICHFVSKSLTKNFWSFRRPSVLYILNWPLSNQLNCQSS